MKKQILFTLKLYTTSFISKVDKIAPKILLIWVITLSILYSTLSIVRHNNFQSGAFDLGIFDQAIWQYSQLIYPYNTIKERFILGDHLTLTLPFFAPLFYAWNDVRILLITQAIWITFSTIAIYKLARIRNFSPFTSLNISFIYSLFYGIQFGVFFDWHPVIFGVGLLAWLAYFFEAKKRKLFWITLIIMLLTQENMGIALASLGIVYFFNSTYRKQAIYFIFGGLLASTVAIFAVSKLSPIGYQYQPHISQNPFVIISQFFNTHDKKLVWLYSFSGFSFFPLLSIGSVLAVILDLSQYFAAANEFGHMLTPYLHHRAILAVFLAIGTMDTLIFLRKKGIKPVAVTTFAVLVVLVLQYIFHFPLNKLFKSEYWKKEQWMNDNKQIIQNIPQKASIATSQNLVPHLSHRKEIYLVWPRKHKDEWWLDFTGKPQYLVVNIDQKQWITQILESPENFKSAVNNMEKDGKITLEQKINSAYLYKINY